MTLDKTNNVAGRSVMERVLFEASVEYRSGHEQLSGSSGDLSIGGLYLKTKLKLRVDDRIKLSFTLPHQEKRVLISCRARVAWTNYETDRRKPNYASGVGLQFLDLSCDGRSTLSAFISNYDESKKMDVVCAWCGNPLYIRKGPCGTTSHGICKQCHEKLTS